MSNHKAKRIIEYRNYYLPSEFPALFLSGEHWKISDRPSEHLHFHNCIEIGLCHSESGTMDFLGASIDFKSSDITCIPRNIPHTTWSSPGQRSLWSYLFVDPALLFRDLFPGNLTHFDLSLSNYPQNKYILSKNEQPEISYLVSLIMCELEEQSNNYQISVRGLLLSLFVKLHQLTLTAAESTNKSEVVKNLLVIAPALNYIEDHYNQQFSIDTLADLCHWTPTHFRRVFNQIMHTSPLDYITNIRIMKACTLLRTTEDSILNISETVGFRSISSLNRYFERIMGTSPRIYRNKMQSAHDNESGKPVIMEFTGWFRPE